MWWWVMSLFMIFAVFDVLLTTCRRWHLYKLQFLKNIYCNMRVITVSTETITTATTSSFIF